MAFTTYDYDLDAVDEAKLSQEILASAISVVPGEFEGIENTGEASPGLNIHVSWTNALSGGDKTLLDAVIAAHPTTEPAPVEGDSVVLGTGNVVNPDLLPDATETLQGIAEIATQAETDAGSDDARFITPLKLASWSGGGSGQTLYDAIVAPSGGDYTLPSAAFAAGKERVWVRAGTYVENATDVVIPSGGVLHGSSGAVLVFTTGQVKIDGQARLTTAGTFSVTSGSTSVTGVGTSFTTLLGGDFIAIGPDFYEIASTPGSNTSLTLVKPWRGPNRSGLPMLGQGMHQGVVVRGVTITGSTHADGGLYIRGLYKGLIHQVAVTDCTHNVKVEYSGNFEISESLTDNSTNIGLTYENCRSVSASSLVASNNTGLGVSIVGGGIAMKFTNCEFGVNGGGGAFVGGTSTDTVFTGCGSKQNTGKGIETAPGTVRAVIDGCTVQFNSGVGVDIDGTQNVISDCQIGNNGSDGVFGGSRSKIVDSFVHNNTGIGINLNGDTDSVVIGNTVDGNTSHGIDVTTTNDALIQGNRVVGNGGWGLQIGASSARNRVGGNTFTSNTSGSINSLNATTLFIPSSTGQLTNNQLLRGATGLPGGGSGLKGSGITIDDSNNVTGVNNLGVGGTFGLSGVISPAQITAQQNNYNPTGLSGASTLRLTSNSGQIITGLAGGATGRIVVIHNVGSFSIRLYAEDAASTAANRFASAVTLQANESVILRYDGTTLRWRQIAGGATTGSDLACASARRTTSFTGSATFADVTFNATDVENDTAVVEHDNTLTDRITVKETGLYLVGYSFEVQPTGTPSTLQGRVRINDTTVIPQGSSMVEEDNEITNFNAVFPVSLTANDFLTVQIQTSVGTETVQAGAMFFVTRLRGVKGDQGPAGAGSTVIVKDENSTVAGGPHSALDFAGAGVSVADAGSGQATITIPGGKSPLTYSFGSGDSVVNLSSTDGSFTVKARFIFPGTTAFGAISSIKAIRSSDNASGRIRIYDLTNAQTIVTSPTISSSTGAGILNLGTLANVPTGEAVFEIQMIRDSGTGGSAVRCSALIVNPT